MSLSDDQVRRIARLARIEIGAEDSSGLRERLNGVLGLIERISAADTAGIEPMAHPLEAELPQGQRLREDAVTEADRRADYQAVAPAVEAGLYLVPKVID